LPWRDWDWQGARLALERATTLAPGLASVHLWHGLFLALQGDLVGAHAAIDRGRHIDPLSGFATALRCFFHEIVGEYEEELALSRQAVELRPELFLGYWSLGHAHVLLGQLEKGKAALQRALDLTEGGLVMRAHFAWALARAGDSEEARRRLGDLDLVANTTFVSACQRAGVLFALGDTAAGLRRFEEGVDQCDPWVVFAGVSPLFAPLRAEPRFAELRQRVGLP
jgi:tetratricopeptide (TPR) repeat protein